ncbi:hypothetical protein ACGFMK_08810 [Amycolatopsis sp. NPDC049252]|uniref:hypothetical protein n=1 Tax=Amycolatopsis sp. NPDC049252 TaxID=3363933 RepID=UPI003717CDE6
MPLPPVRVIGPDGRREWRDLRLAALRDAPRTFSASLADQADAPEERWRQRLRGTHNLVADLDGRPAGMATGFPRDAAVEPGTTWAGPVLRQRNDSALTPSRSR